jgi:hypothetical protein
VLQASHPDNLLDVCLYRVRIRYVNCVVYSLSLLLSHLLISKNTLGLYVRKLSGDLIYLLGV